MLHHPAVVLLFAADKLGCCKDGPGGQRETQTVLPSAPVAGGGADNIFADGGLATDGADQEDLVPRSVEPETGVADGANREVRDSPQAKAKGGDLPTQP